MLRRIPSLAASALLAACVVAAAPSLAAAQAPAASLPFTTCGASQMTTPTAGLQCATLAVPLDPSAPTLGSLSLAVQRIPARAAQTGTIVFLAGGPGQPALPAFESAIAPLLDVPSLAGFQLVAFDQRGTGQSGALTCPGDSASGAAFITSCGNALGTTRGDYTSQDSVSDLQALVQALGGSPISIVAVSYGGRVAGAFAREFPAEVARMVLDSPVPPGGSDPLDSQRERALERVLNDGICVDGTACRGISSDLYGSLVHVMERVGAKSLRAKIVSAHGRPTETTITAGGVYTVIAVSDLLPGVRALLPAAVSAAAHGDPRQLGRLTSEVGSGIGTDSATPARVPFGAQPSATSARLSLPVPVARAAQASAATTETSAVLFATSCVESQLPWSPQSALASREAALESYLATLPKEITAPFPLSAVLPDTRIGLCLEWPPTPPAPPDPGGTSSTPTLILAGDDDLREPIEQDATVAAGFSNAQILRIPGTGHSTLTTDRTGCADRAAIAFLGGAAAPSTCPSPAGDTQVLPRLPASLAQATPGHSSDGSAARAGGAVAATIEDVLAQPANDGGGVVGGDWSVSSTGDSIAFRRVVDVPGVAVSGTIRSDLTGTVTVSGAATGTLTLARTRLSGHVDGHSVTATLPILG